MTRPRGFSLLELLVSLVILASVATVALRSVNGVQSQGRYQATTRSLDDIRIAVAGEPNLHGPDGSALVNGFVADVGRPPQYLSASDPLGELLAPNGITAFKLSNPKFGIYEDPAVLIGTGWQGSYVRQGSGSTTLLRDGWGTAFECRNAASVPITVAGTEIVEIRAFAADKKADDNGGSLDDYFKDVSISLRPGGLDTTRATFKGLVQGRKADGTIVVPSGPVWVYYFGPKDDGTVVRVGVQVDGITDNWQYVLSGTVISPAPTGTAYISDSAITIGPRILKAYKGDPATTDPTTLQSSPPLNVVGRAGVQQLPVLFVPE